MEKKWPAVYDIEMMKMEAWEGFKVAWEKNYQELPETEPAKNAMRSCFMEHWKKRLKVLGLR